MHRFFADIIDSEVRLTETDAFHLLGVLRVENNEHIEVVFEGKLYECAVLSLVPLKIAVIEAIERVHTTPLNIVLFMCLTKNDKPETVIERATELGVQEIVIVSSDRSVVKLDEDQVVKRLVRYNRIAESAAKQSKRMDIPQVVYLPFKSIFDYKKVDFFLMGEANDKALNVNHTFPQFSKGQSVAILIGPEGGFSDKELENTAKHGVIPVTFSSNVLRSEVASVTALSILNYLSLQLK